MKSLILRFSSCFNNLDFTEFYLRSVRFHADLILLRIKSLLRRVRQYGQEAGKKQEKSSRLCCQDLILDLDAQQAILGDRSVALTHTEFRILELFLSHPGKIFSLENIYQSIWEEEAVGDGTIMAHIKNIRKKLGDSPRNPRYIKTAWGKGYYVD